MGEGEGETAESYLEEQVGRNNSVERGSEPIWILSHEREIFKGELLGKGFNCMEENVREIFT